MLLEHANPYHPPLPRVLTLGWEDFDFALSSVNRGAIGTVADWTVLAYLAADCDLAAPMYEDLRELKSVGSGAALHVCALFDGPLVTDAYFVRLNAGSSLHDDLVLRWWELQTHQKDTLVMAIQVAAAWPGRRRLLVLGGHGNGWKGLLQDRNIGFEYQRTPGRVRLPGPLDECKARLVQSQLAAQACINERIETVAKPERPRYDVMAFDACYMGNLEAIVELSDHADILVVSEDLVPGEGYPYDRVLRELDANPAQSPVEFARRMVAVTGAAHAEPVRRARPIAQVALASDGLPPLAVAFARLAAALTAAMDDDAVRRAARYAINMAYRFGATGYIDLVGFVRKLGDHALPEPVRERCTDVLAQWQRTLIAAAVPGTPDGPNGLSIYAPAPREFDPAYIDTAARFRHGLSAWAIFLARYYLVVLGDEAPGHPLLQAIDRARRAAAARDAD